ncbi:MAG: polyprenyl diphosphate synthase [Serpentinimonas sp.]|nr:polyprenyl diphosphate synthase [Serpentinimonas sp.]
MARQPSPLPQHVAVVMDGNGRWARKRLLPRLAGHRQGLEALRGLVRWGVVRGIKVLTVFAFSSENWTRPPEEVSGLMGLLLKAVSRELPELQQQGVRLYFVGERDGLAAPVREAVQSAETATAGNTRLVLNICFNYGGRWDVAQAARALAERGEAITEESLAGALALAHVPDPDLLIRTGGEQRISNFLLWQLAYTELYFSERLWPEVDDVELDKALQAFAQRERRFGGLKAEPAVAGLPAQGETDTAAASAPMGRHLLSAGS